MSDDRATAALIGGVTLLERAINYTHGSLGFVTPERLPSPTPCRGWDLRTLLAHMDDSLIALHQAVAVGRVDVSVPSRAGSTGAAPPGSIDPVASVELVASLRSRACQLLGAWASADPAAPPVSVAGTPLTAGVVSGAGAIEIAVHGWDVARACGQRWPIPSSLAAELLELAPLFVDADDRPARFGAPVALSPAASPGDRLIAFLGRRP